MQVKLYDSNKSAGVVNRENFMLELKEPQLIINNAREKNSLIVSTFFLGSVSVKI